MRELKQRRRIYIYAMIMISLFVIFLGWLIIATPVLIYFKILFLLLVISLTVMLCMITVPEIESLNSQIKLERDIYKWRQSIG